VRHPEERRTTDPATGRTVTAVGQALVAGVPQTSVKELLETPAQFVGKTVTIEGAVTAMCRHRRAWFAVVEAEGNTPLRVITVPNFRVPADAMGQRARTSGVVESVEVSPQTVSHLSKSHGLPAASRAVILRATGAEFY
jgi:hypothetical protein